MSKVRPVYHLARADFLERVRSYSFLIVLGATILLAYLLVPVDEAHYTVMRFSGYRGIYNSAWIGVMVSLPTAVVYALAGFYIVKNSITRDMETGVGQIVATTPLSKLHYIFGKYISNFLVLAFGVTVIFFSALAMQFIRGESYTLELWSLLAPFIYLTIPVMALVSALALFFESVSWLRKGFGNIVFFFLWLFAMTLSAAQLMDPLGLNMVLPQIQEFAASYLGKPGVSAIILGTGEKTGTFIWPGIDWTAGMLLERLLWIGASLLTLPVASLLFNRFDSSREMLSLSRPKRKRRQTDSHVLAPVSTGMNAGSLTPALRGFSFTRLVLMEFRLMLKGMRWWWYLGAVGLIAGALLVQDFEQIPLLMAVTWVWPVLIWSRMGCREVSYHTEQVVFSTPGQVRRQLPAAWLAGYMVALLSASGVVLRLAAEGYWEHLPGIVVGAAFVISLALALGVISKGSKAFEVSYISLFWYFGLVNGISYLDFVGLSAPARGTVSPLFHLVAGLVLFATAALVRRRQAV